MIKKIVWVSLGALVILAGAGIGRMELTAGPTVNVTLTAVPATYTGSCPVTIHFEGKIKVSGPCTVKYKFVRSDGALVAPVTLVCPAAGVYPITTTWTLGMSYSGWIAVEVLSPVAVKSDKAGFTITCIARPKITGAHLHYGGQPKPEMDIVGANFGATQGTKNVRIDGTLVSSMPGWSVIHWGDTGVTLQTNGVTPWDHTYQIAITDGAAVISNIYAAKFLFTIDGVNPSSGTVGTTVNVNAFSVPPAMDGYVVKIGTYTMTVVTWGSPIKAKVPPGVPAGAYQIYLQKGADVVSNKVNFTVI